MSLTVPTADELAAFQHLEVVDDLTFADNALQLATDLMSVATGLTTDPTDEVQLRLMKSGIMDMAWYHLIQNENKDALYTPFSSERIGSYSYSKVAQSVARKESTGIDLFDAAVAMLKSDDLAVASLTAETVFVSPYSTAAALEQYPNLEQAADGTWWLPAPDVAG